MLGRKRILRQIFLYSAHGKPENKILNSKTPLDLSESGTHPIHLLHTDLKLPKNVTLTFTFPTPRLNGKLFIVLTEKQYSGKNLFANLTESLTHLHSIEPNCVVFDLDEPRVQQFVNPLLPVLTASEGNWSLNPLELKSGLSLTLSIEGSSIKFANDDGGLFGGPNLFDVALTSISFIYGGDTDVVVTFSEKYEPDVKPIGVYKNPTPQLTHMTFGNSREAFEFNGHDLEGYSQLYKNTLPPLPGVVYVRLMFIVSAPYIRSQSIIMRDSFPDSWSSIIYTNQPDIFGNVNKFGIHTTSSMPNRNLPIEMSDKVNFFYTTGFNINDYFEFYAKNLEDPLQFPINQVPIEIGSDGLMRSLLAYPDYLLGEKYDLDNPVSFPTGLQTNPIYIYHAWCNTAIESYAYNSYFYPQYLPTNILSTIFVPPLSRQLDEIYPSTSFPLAQPLSIYQKETLQVTNFYANESGNPNLSTFFWVRYHGDCTLQAAVDVDVAFKFAKRHIRRSQLGLLITADTTAVGGADLIERLVRETPFDIRAGFEGTFQGLENIIQPFLFLTTEIVFEDNQYTSRLNVRWLYNGAIRQTSVIIGNYLEAAFDDFSDNYYATTPYFFLLAHTPTFWYIGTYYNHANPVTVKIPINFGINPSLLFKTMHYSSLEAPMRAATAYSDVGNESSVFVPEKISLDFTIPSVLATTKIAKEVTLAVPSMFYRDPTDYNKVPATGNVCLKYLMKIERESTAAVFKFIRNLVDDFGEYTFILTTDPELTYFVPTKTGNFEVSLAELDYVCNSKAGIYRINMSKSSIDTGNSLSVRAKYDSFTDPCINGMNMTMVLNNDGALYSAEFATRILEGYFKPTDEVHLIIGTTSNRTEFETRSQTMLNRFDYLPYARQTPTTYLNPPIPQSPRDTSSQIVWASHQIRFATPATMAVGKVLDNWAVTNTAAVPEFFVKFNHAGASSSDRDKLISNFFNTVTFGITLIDTSVGNAWESVATSQWPASPSNGLLWRQFTANNLNPKTANAFLVNNGGAFKPGSYVCNVIFTPKVPSKIGNGYVAMSDVRINSSQSGTISVSDFETRRENTSMVEDIDATGTKIGTTTYVPLSFATQQNNSGFVTTSVPIVSEFYPSGKAVNIRNAKMTGSDATEFRLWYFVYSTGEGSGVGKHATIPNDLSFEIGIRVGQITNPFRSTERRHAWSHEAV
jgi:hypothetical protein